MLPSIQRIGKVFVLLASNVCHGVRVFDAERSLDSVQLSTFQQHMHTQMSDVIRGIWNSDYHVLVQDSRVFITDLEGSHIQPGGFSAASESFGEATNGARVITLVKVYPIRTGVHGQTLAELTQRLDLTTTVRRTGRLFLEKKKGGTGSIWVIEWKDPKSGWCRHWWKDAELLDKDGDVVEEEPSSQDQAAVDSARKLFDDWQQACLKESSGAKTLVPSLAFYHSLTLGLDHGGASITLLVQMCFDNTQVQHHYAHLKCMTQRMKDEAARENGDIARDQMRNTQEEAHVAPDVPGADKIEDTPDVVQQGNERGEALSSIFGEYIRSASLDCIPGLCFHAGFSVMPHPPFLWPLPHISATPLFNLTFTEIYNCFAGTDAAKIIEEARAAGEQGQAAEMIRQADETHTQHSLSAPSVVLTKTVRLGPYIALTPLPSIGLCSYVDLTLALSLRAMVRKRAARPSVFSAGGDQCDVDRRVFYKRYLAWHKLAKKFEVQASTRSECAPALETLDAIQAAHPGVDWRNEPISMFPHLEQLGGELFVRPDMRETDLGGGFACIHLQGLILAVYARAIGRREHDFTYRHECKAFAKYVNFYHDWLKPALDDVYSNDGCDYNIPNMQDGQCHAVQLDGLPTYPHLVVDEHYNILEETASKCTECAKQFSEGLPCSFCNRLGFIGSPSCLDHSVKRWQRTPCTSITSFPIRTFGWQDRQLGHNPRDDPRLVCAASGGSVVMRKSAGDQKVEVKVKKKELKELLREDMFQDFSDSALTSAAGATEALGDAAMSGINAVGRTGAAIGNYAYIKLAGDNCRKRPSAELVPDDQLP